MMKMGESQNSINCKLKLTQPWPFPKVCGNPPFTVRSLWAVPLIGIIVKVWLKVFNTTKLHNMDTLNDAISGRPKGVPLITVCNHYSCIDDPGIWGILRLRELTNARVMRWGAAAHDIAFTRKFYNWFFPAGKAVPIVRGLGVYQQSMNFLLERLNRGEWLQLFPEGKVNMEREKMRMKWGIGRLIYDSNVTPIVLPFYHIGMNEILPNYKPYIPRVGKRVTVLIGEPLQLGNLISQLREENASPEHARKIITDRIQEELWKLREKTTLLHQQTT